MFGPKQTSPKIFTMTPEYARGVIQKSIEDSIAMIAVAETLLGDERTPKQKKMIGEYIKEEQGRIRRRRETLGLVGADSIACNLEELIEFNSSFPTNKTGLDLREAFEKSLAKSDEDED